VARRFFSPDYTTARLRFAEAADTRGWTLDAREVDARGPGAEPLWIHAATSQGGDPRRTLVVSSGLHGVEGFFGSAVQLAVLERWHTPPVRIVLLHAINPYGFAWLRRTDEFNVDLNRNFLRDGEAFAGSPPGYARLDPILNPQSAKPSRLPLVVALMPAIARRGLGGVRQDIAGGQYEFPRGLFFGGVAPSPTRRVIEAAMPGWLAGSEEVIHLDLHTGLGPSGQGQLLDDAPAAGASYTARGGFGSWCVSRGLAKTYSFAYAEIGTFSSLRVLAGLRVENQAHHYGQSSDPATIRAKDRLKQLFCPDDEEWQSRAVDAALGFVDAAVQDLLAAASGATIRSLRMSKSDRR
jgi:hypothetical protein